VIRFNGSLAEAAGIDSAGSTEVACVNYPKISGRHCFSDIYYVDMPSILKDSHLGVKGLTLNT
jgi:hypothetical protein